MFDAGKPEENEEGGRVYEVRKSEVQSRETSRTAVELRFGHGDIDFSRVHVGDKLWKTSDPELDRRLRQSFEGDAPKFQRPIEIEVHGVAGKPLTLIARDEFGNVAKVESSMPLAKAEKQPLTTERLREQLGRLGGTPFKLGELKNNLSGEVLLPVSELNRLRREVVGGTGTTARATEAVDNSMIVAAEVTRLNLRIPSSQSLLHVGCYESATSSSSSAICRNSKPR